MRKVTLVYTNNNYLSPSFIALVENSRITSILEAARIIATNIF
jgi:hypothetical protein